MRHVLDFVAIADQLVAFVEFTTQILVAEVHWGRVGGRCRRLRGLRLRILDLGLFGHCVSADRPVQVEQDTVFFLFVELRQHQQVIVGVLWHSLLLLTLM